MKFRKNKKNKSVTKENTSSKVQDIQDLKKLINEKEALGNAIEAFLNKHQISAILFVPELGPFSIFQSEGDKLLLLEHALIDIKHRQQMIDDEIKSRLMDEHIHMKKFHINTISPTYIN